MTTQSQVFLSFCSHDTGKTFTDHLHTALLNAGIQTHDTMERSKIALVVLSKKYVSTTRCLDELAKIIAFQPVVIPIFYDVDPSEIRTHQSFEQVFDQDGLLQRHDDDDKVKRWRYALGQVVDLGGMVLQNRHESKFIKEIVQVVERKLNRRSLSVAVYPIGLDSRVKSINQWLQDGSTRVDIMALYGMGGIGKTTVAKTVYNLNFDKFDGSSFISSIRRATEQPNGLVRLQRQLLSDISRKKIKKIHNIDEGIMKIRDAISCKRVFIVLDDVDQLDELNAMLGLRKWFYPGSKIMITTRHKSLLESKQQVEMYEIKGFNGKESLELFSWHAFGEDHPPPDDDQSYTKLSRNVVYHCGGIPLALVVLGSSLRGRSIDIWESALKKLQAISERDIVGKLRISYDSLPDDHDRSLFLDISCFFVGKEKEYVMMILEKCDYYTEVGIQNLVDRCLLDVDKQNKLLVHQLLQDMGREIIRQESPHPGRRTRIWSHRDSYNVLKHKSGGNEIRGLVLDMKMLKEGKSMKKEDRKKRGPEDILEKMFLMDQSYASKRRRLDFFGNASNASSSIQDDIDLKTDAFTRMQNLRLLKLSHIQITGCYDQFPKGLRWLYWQGFPLKYLPNEFPLESLVALDMRNSSLMQFQKSINRSLMMMEVLNLSHSHYLKKSPDFSMLPNLKRLILKECIRLAELHESIVGLTRLVLLNLSGCRNLTRLPSQFHRLGSLEKLILSGCSKLEKLPVEELGKLQSLKMLHADEIAISHIASNRHELIEWRSFFPSWLSKPRTCRVPTKFSLASFSSSLLSLSLAHCNLSDKVIPSDLTRLCSLRYLNLSGNPICELPERIKDLSMLRDLWLDSCTSLQSLPELPMSLVDLKTVNCTSLERITNLPNLLKSLFLDVSGCEKLVEVQGLFRLEPLRKFGADRVMNELGILNLDIIENTPVELFNKLTKTRQKDVVQGLFEFGIFSTYVPGNETPAGWCSSKSRVNSISLVLPSDPENSQLQGFNICLTYGRSKAKKFRHWSNQDWCTFYIKIHNKTKELKWVYSPTFVGIPDDGQDITLISHWKNFGKEVENGGDDDVTVSIVGMSYAFQIKGFDVDLLYVQQDMIKITHDHTCTTTTGLISAYQLQPRAYFFSNPEYFMLRGSRDDIGEWTRTILYENLFDKVTVCACDGGEEEDDDSGYDYPEHSDEEIQEYDDDDDDWLNAILHAP